MRNLCKTSLFVARPQALGLRSVKPPKSAGSLLLYFFEWGCLETRQPRKRWCCFWFSLEPSHRRVPKTDTPINTVDGQNPASLCNHVKHSETILCWYLPGSHHFGVSERWCVGWISQPPTVLLAQEKKKDMRRSDTTLPRLKLGCGRLGARSLRALVG